MGEPFVTMEHLFMIKTNSASFAIIAYNTENFDLVNNECLMDRVKASIAF